MKKMSLNYVNMNVWVVIIIVLVVLLILTGAGIGLYFVFRKSPDDKSSDKSSDGGDGKSGKQNGGKLIPISPSKYNVNSPYKISAPSLGSIGNNTFAISSGTGEGLMTINPSVGNFITIVDPVKYPQDCKKWLFTYANITNQAGKTLENVFLWHGDGKSIIVVSSTTHWNYQFLIAEPNFNVTDPGTYGFSYDPVQKRISTYRSPGIAHVINDPVTSLSVILADVPSTTTSDYQWDMIPPMNIKQCR